MGTSGKNRVADRAVFPEVEQFLSGGGLSELPALRNVEPPPVENCGTCASAQVASILSYLANRYGPRSNIHAKVVRMIGYAKTVEILSGSATSDRE